MINAVPIGPRRVGPGHPVLIVAEAGVNHDGDPSQAVQLVRAAAAAGADAIKFQTFSAERLASRAAPKAPYQEVTCGRSESQGEMLRRLELPMAAYPELLRESGQGGLLFLSTPFDEEGADSLDGLGVPAFKIGSGDLTHDLLLAHIAAKGKPIVLSTGLATLEEVRRAVGLIRQTGSSGLILLHCVSCYPARAEDANLRAMLTLRDEFGLPVGYSDHTEGVEVALAAVALGACVVEKHLTLDRRLPGPDHAASLDPSEFARLVRGIRTVEAALGDGRKGPCAEERINALVVRRSLVAARRIPEGTVLTRDLVAVKRPGTGLSPARMSDLLGRRARLDIPADEMLKPEMFQ